MRSARAGRLRGPVGGSAGFRLGLGLKRRSTADCTTRTHVRLRHVHFGFSDSGSCTRFPHYAIVHLVLSLMISHIDHHHRKCVPKELSRNRPRLSLQLTTDVPLSILNIFSNSNSFHRTVGRSPANFHSPSIFLYVCLIIACPCPLFSTVCKSGPV